MKKYKYSEIFTSIQGEGVYTGVPSIWLRWFLCNLQCNGFGQKQPENPETHILPYKEFDVSTVDKIEDLPVWDYGCDSSYSWSKKYKHLCPSRTIPEIADKLELELSLFKDNPEGKFSLPSTREVKDVHLCLTGGEPMMPKTQDATLELLMELADRENLPRFITVETNGTQHISDELGRVISSYVASGGEWFWSVSPKLLYTSGEQSGRAIQPWIVKAYQSITGKGQLKYVVCNRPEAWDELEETIDQFRNAGIHWPVWIMPVGATIESQSDDDMRAVVEEAIKRGYNVSARLQAYIWGNTIGT